MKNKEPIKLIKTTKKVTAPVTGVIDGVNNFLEEHYFGGSPKEIRQARAASDAACQKSERKGNFDIVSSQHDDPILAAIGERYETILKHPLVQRYIKGKPPTLYYDNLPGMMRREEGRRFRAASNNSIIIPNAYSVRPPEEIVAAVAHELGHVILGDLEKTTYQGHKSENLADKISVALTGTPMIKNIITPLRIRPILLISLRIGNGPPKPNLSINLLRMNLPKDGVFHTPNTKRVSVQ